MWKIFIRQHFFSLTFSRNGCQTDEVRTLVSCFIKFYKILIKSFVKCYKTE